MIKHIVLAVFCCMSIVHAADRNPFGEVNMNTHTPVATRSPKTAPDRTRKSKSDPHARILSFIETRLDLIKESDPAKVDVTQLACGLVRFVDAHSEDLPAGAPARFIGILTSYVYYSIEEPFIDAAHKDCETHYKTYLIPVDPALARQLF